MRERVLQPVRFKPYLHVHKEIGSMAVAIAVVTGDEQVCFGETSFDLLPGFIKPQINLTHHESSRAAACSPGRHADAIVAAVWITARCKSPPGRRCRCRRTASFAGST